MEAKKQLYFPQIEHICHGGPETEPHKLVSILDIFVAPINKSCVGVHFGSGQAAPGAFGVPVLIVSVISLLGTLIF